MLTVTSVIEIVKRRTKFYVLYYNLSLDNMITVISWLIKNALLVFGLTPLLLIQYIMLINSFVVGLPETLLSLIEIFLVLLESDEKLSQAVSLWVISLSGIFVIVCLLTMGNLLAKIRANNRTIITHYDD